MGYKKTTKPTKEELYKLYVADGLTSRQIAELYDCSFKTVLRCIHKHGIKVKAQGEERRKDLEDRDWLLKEYQSKPIDQIAEENNSSSGTIRRILRMFDIPINPQGTPKGYKLPEADKKKMSEARKGKYIGKDHWNWKGGDNTPSRERRSYAAKKWRNDVKDRDSHTCQNCGIADVVTHAHHIKSWKEHPKLRYDISNGITLCVKCHQKEHGFPFPSWIYNQGQRPMSAEHRKVKI